MSNGIHPPLMPNARSLSSVGLYKPLMELPLTGERTFLVRYRLVRDHFPCGVLMHIMHWRSTIRLRTIACDAVNCFVFRGRRRKLDWTLE